MADENENIEDEGVVDDAVIVEDDQPETLSEVDELAVELGWQPKSKWSGPEDGWTDSKTFLKKSRDLNRSLSRELKDIKKTVEGIGKATAGMTQKAVEAERERLLALREEAFDTGDRDTHAKVDKALAQLDAPQAVPSAAVEDFAERNADWFQKDQEATDYAFVRATFYQNKGITDPAAQLAKVEEDVKKRFPEHFPDAPQARKAPPALGSPQRQVTAQPRDKGIATLPPQARKAAKDWVSTMKENGNAWATEAMWAENYYGQEAANG